MLTREEIKRIASISKLIIKDEEIEEYRKDMSKIIEFIDGINQSEEIDIDEFDSITNTENVFNEDVVIQSYDVSEILKNSKDAEDGYFLIKKRKGN